MLLAETLQARIEWHDILNMMKEIQHKTEDSHKIIMEENKGRGKEQQQQQKRHNKVSPYTDQNGRHQMTSIATMEISMEIP